jgi:hypothetical protein
MLTVSVFIFLALVFVSFLAIKARGNFGARKSTLYEA